MITAQVGVGGIFWSNGNTNLTEIALKEHGRTGIGMHMYRDCFKKKREAKKWGQKLVGKMESSFFLLVVVF